MPLRTVIDEGIHYRVSNGLQHSATLNHGSHFNGEKLSHAVHSVQSAVAKEEARVVVGRDAFTRQGPFGPIVRAWTR